MNVYYGDVVDGGFVEWKMFGGGVYDLIDGNVGVDVVVGLMKCVDGDVSFVVDDDGVDVGV